MPGVRVTKTQEENDGKVYTTSNGCPVDNPYAAQMIGTPNSRVGPLLLQDFHLLDLIGHFDRERIPERVVHANGAGAHGYFEVTHDVSDIATSKFLLGIGKKTKLSTRFSTVALERGSPDTVRDPRGFSVKLFTEEGVIDWVYNNTPIFFMRNPNKFVYFIHTQKRHPQSGLRDMTMFWDYFVQNQEAVHQVMILFSDRGTPQSYRHMHGYSGHTFKWIKEDGSFNYVQIHLKTDQGIKTYTDEEAVKVAGENPDACTADLFEHIEKGEFPSWTCYVQVMSPEEAKEQDFSVFDLTKTWPQDKFPLRPFGRMVLDKNPDNYFAEVEQIAFAPSHTVPGWEPSADPVLQSRLFSYTDTHRHRLGPNYHQIPVNKCPVMHNPFIRDGPMCVDGNYGSMPNYPSSYEPIAYSKKSVASASNLTEEWQGAACPYEWDIQGEHDYAQAAKLWEVYGKTGQQETMIKNLSGHVSGAKKRTQEEVVKMFSNVNPEIGERLAASLKALEESS